MIWNRGFQWFIPEWFEEKWWDLTDNRHREGFKELYKEQTHFRDSNQYNEFTCNKEDMQKAVNGSLRINKAFYGSLTDNVVDVPNNHSVSGLKADYEKKISKYNENHATTITESNWAAF